MPLKKAPQSSLAPAAWAWARAVAIASASVSSLAQGRHEGGLGLLLAEALARHRAEHRVGAELEVGAGALLGEGRDRVGEADRLAHVCDPVGGVGRLLGVEQLPADVGDDRDLGLVVGEGLGDLGELLQHRLDQGRVEGVGDGEALGLSSLALPLAADRFDRFLAAGDRRSTSGR